MLNPTISTTNNRFDSGQGYSYDSSGNTTADAEGRTFVYDAENKQVEVIESSTTIGEYIYDGDGKRVKKIAGAEETIFVYDAGGKLIGEYSSIVQTGSNAKTVYTTNDHLGSPRINTDGVGSVISRHDYHPFGEEIARTGYGSDTIRKQFTGYERDGETGLDFAQARYFVKQLGRFNSPDGPFIDQFESDPQSWNLYLYVRNNPLRFADPTGLWRWADPDQNGYRFVIWEEGDDWKSLRKFLSDETGVLYYESTLENFFGQEGMAPLGEGLVLDLGHFDEKPMPGPHGLQDATIESLPMGRGAQGVQKTGVLQWLLRKLGIGAAKQTAKKQITKSAKWLSSLSRGDQGIFKEAMQRAASKGGSFRDNVESLTEAVMQKNPSNQVWQIGNVNGSPVFGSVRSGLGIVEQGGKTFVVRKTGSSDSAFEILGEFAP